MFPTEFTLEAYALMNNYFTGLTVINLVFIMPLFLGKLRLNEVGHWAQSGTVPFIALG